MKTIKNLALMGALVLAVSATTVTAFAASNYMTPAEITAGLTGRTVENVVAEKFENGTTYGQLAENAGKIDEFKNQMLENKKAILSQRVFEGTMTQEESDEIIAALEKNQTTCDGTGSSKIGQTFGANFGGMMGNGQGHGKGLGNGQGSSRNQNGNGLGLRDGSCITE